MKKAATISVVVALLLSGCVTMSPEAERIFVHSQITTQLDGCQRVGPVTVESRGGPMTYMQAAEHALREEVVKVYGNKADTVAVINSDLYALGKVVMQGIAYKCF